MRSTFLFLLACGTTLAYDLPPSLKALYNNLTSPEAPKCSSYIDKRSNLHDGHGGKGFGFCIDIPGAVYIAGPKSGELADMDVDCDGSNNCGGESHDYQAGTAFDDELVKSYGIGSLDAAVHPYVVLGTCDVDVSRMVKPLSVVALVCGGELHYGVFGDTNGCDDDNFTGEASVAMANLCFPKDGLNGENGHDEHDILYLAFTSEKAVPGPDSDIWKLKDPAKFEASLKVIGDALIAETIDNYTNNATKSEGDRLGMGGSWKTWVPTMAVMLVAGSWIL